MAGTMEFPDDEFRVHQHVSMESGLDGRNNQPLCKIIA